MSEFYDYQRVSYENGELKELDGTPIVEVKRLGEGFYHLVDANVESINGQNDELYPFRVSQQSQRKGFVSKKISKVNLDKFVKHVRSKFGTGQYELNMMTHMPIIADNQVTFFTSEMLTFLRVVASASLNIGEKDYQLNMIDDLSSWMFMMEDNSVVSLQTWREMMSDTIKEMIDNGEDQQSLDSLQYMIDQTAEQTDDLLNEKFMNISPVECWEVWDKINIERKRVYAS